MIKYNFIALIILIGCSGKKTEKPAGLLSETQMVNLLIDIHLLEAKVQKLYLSKDSAVQVYTYFEEKIFQDQGVNDSLYNVSLAFYTKELGQLKSIYEQVVDSLLARQVAKDMKMSVDSLRWLKNVKDSIKTKIKIDSTSQDEKSDSLKSKTITDSLELNKLSSKMSKESDSLKDNRAKLENDSISTGDRR